MELMTKKDNSSLVARTSVGKKKGKAGKELRQRKKKKCMPEGRKGTTKRPRSTEKKAPHRVGETTEKGEVGDHWR